ncbi:gamma-interferon-inducible lysosomal thiol reductase-like [Ixodes scapularis]|uniref:gamma-interferon-inducible lysosomal thiol reductase-like n=1 Tax=Ixodes scapularis TaxID=6945 RepID=UPI001C3870E4|nr:gamma-interferon-inducible lysosomal thiol reductase-like [Ixodes scapularis]
MLPPASGAAVPWLTLFFLSQGHAIPEASKVVSTSTVVKVRLFYESYCPFSQRFITDQLWPTYEKLGELVEIRLIPFGLATIKKFTRKDAKKPRVRQLHVRVSKSPLDVAQACAGAIGLNWKIIDRCVKSKLGSLLFYKMGQKTWALVPHITYVPYIEVDGWHSKLFQEEAMSNLFGLVCSRLGSAKPDICNVS